MSKTSTPRPAPPHPTDAEQPTPCALFPSCDPGGEIGRVLAGRHSGWPTAKDTILAWMVALPQRIDPAHAARALLAVDQSRRRAPESRFAIEVIALLVEIAALPRERLAAVLSRRRRRP